MNYRMQPKRIAHVPDSCRLYLKAEMNFRTPNQNVLTTVERRSDMLVESV